MKSSGSKKKTGLETRLVAALLLTRIIDDGRNLDALCDKEHGLKRFLALPGNDRGLARAIVMSALRNRNRIDKVISKATDRAPPKRARFLIHMLHVAIAQILFLEVPDSAAVDLAVSAIGDDERTARFRGMTNAVLRRVVREKDSFLAMQSETPFPSWFSKKLRSDYGKEKSAAIGSMIVEPPLVDLSVKERPEYWAENLGGFVLPDNTVRLTNRDAIETLNGYESGDWWVQDAAASLPAKLILSSLDGPSSQCKVLDLCAAPGGKTAQLANAGCNVTAVDISKPRLARLASNLERLQLEANLIEADILEWEPQELFDAVLLDAPCSSTGTCRRHPDVVWTKSAQDVRELAQLQFSLFKKAIQFVRPGGVIVFSNCALFKEEGENLLARMMREVEGLEFSAISPDEMPGFEEAINGQGAVRTLPTHLAQDPKSHGGVDGFFACRFKRV